MPNSLHQRRISAPTLRPIAGRAKPLALALLLSACGRTYSDDTALVLQVWSDLDVPAEIDAIDLAVTTVSTTTRHLPLDQQATGMRPHILQHLALLPSGPSASADRPVRVTISGLQVGRVVLSQTVQTVFVPGSRRLLKLTLDRACVPISCSSGSTCEAGICVADERRDLPVDPGP